jgi:hypothetical protein
MREFGESVLSNLSSSDPRICGSVIVSHPTGPDSVVACAYVERIGDWIFVFGLFDGVMLFDKDQVLHWRQQSEFVRTKLACQPVVSTTARNKSFLALAA